MKTINIDLSCAEGSATYDGGGVLEIIGRTPGNISVKVRVTLAPTAVGYLGACLHRIVRGLQEKVDQARKRLTEGD